LKIFKNPIILKESSIIGKSPITANDDLRASLKKLQPKYQKNLKNKSIIS